jgi:hypothetical protein
VVVVTATLVGPLGGLPFELDATPIAMAAMPAAPNRTQVVVLKPTSWACLTPAGLPGVNEAVSAAIAAEAVNADDKMMAVNVRIGSPQCIVFL